MSILKTFKSDKYEDGRTKQSFKDQCDINKIIARAQKTGTVSHLAKYQGVYGDFSDVDDLLTAHDRLKRGQKIFDELPSEVRKEFDQDVGKFYRFVNDPANADRLAEVLPDLAKPGRQMPDVLHQQIAASASAGAAGPSSPVAADALAAEGGEATE